MESLISKSECEQQACEESNIAIRGVTRVFMVPDAGEIYEPVDRVHPEVDKYFAFDKPA